MSLLHLYLPLLISFFEVSIEAAFKTHISRHYFTGWTRVGVCGSGAPQWSVLPVGRLCTKGSHQSRNQRSPRQYNGRCGLQPLYWCRLYGGKGKFILSGNFEWRLLVQVFHSGVTVSQTSVMCKTFSILTDDFTKIG